MAEKKAKPAPPVQGAVVPLPGTQVDLVARGRELLAQARTVGEVRFRKRGTTWPELERQRRGIDGKPDGDPTMFDA
jgi:hypothetical protein